MAKSEPGKGDEIKRALVDFVFVSLLVVGAGFGGYYYGIAQRLAPVQTVPAGTPGAVTATAAAPASGTATKPEPQSTTVVKPAAADKKAASKYWISSSGSDYVGYSITVKVNDDTVDNFFGPGKNFDVTKLVKPGDNTVSFEAKALGADYNKHAGDSKSILTVQLVHGPFIQENYKESDVLLSYKRSAADSGDNSATMHFSGE